ncbi:MAG: efflux transporter outer membrane subunit [Telluria sp.]
MRHLRLTKTAAAVLALALAGCVHIPADQSQAKGPDFDRVQHDASLALARDAWPAQEWWKQYTEPQLDELVTRALRDNPTMAVAQARIASARAAVGAERAAEGPQVDLAGGLNRQRYSGTGLFPEPIGGNWFNDTSVQVRASYDFDWWGRHRAAVAAALGEANARQADAAQAAQTIAAGVAQSYFRLQSLWARERNTRQQIAVERDILSGRKLRLKQGLVNIDMVQSAEQDLASLDTQAESYAGQAARELEALRALVGAGADNFPNIVRRQIPAEPYPALPRKLGMELLARRPDLQAARWRVEAALGRTRAAEAAFYPDINLSAAAGLDTVSVSRLLEWASRTMLAGAVFSLPIFDSGRLETGLGVARAQRDELIADYNQSVLNAVRDVSQEAATLQGLAKQRRAQLEATRAAVQLQHNAEARVKAGLAESTAVLQAQLAYLRLADTSIQLFDAELQTQVALVKALGGGYRAEPAQVAANTQQNNHAIAK